MAILIKPMRCTYDSNARSCRRTERRHGRVRQGKARTKRGDSSVVLALLNEARARPTCGVICVSSTCKRTCSFCGDAMASERRSRETRRGERRRRRMEGRERGKASGGLKSQTKTAHSQPPLRLIDFASKGAAIALHITATNVAGEIGSARACSTYGWMRLGGLRLQLLCWGSRLLRSFQ